MALGVLVDGLHERHLRPIHPDEMRAVLGAACQGSGLGLVFRQFATAEIASGAVVPILDQFLPPDQPFHLYDANRAHMPSKLRAFIEFMQTVSRKASK